MTAETSESRKEGLPGRDKVADFVEIAGALPPSSAVMAGGDRVEDLRLVESARDHGIIDRIVLVGKRDRISAAVDAVGIAVPPEDIVAADTEEDAAATTVKLVKAGVGNMVLKGSTPTDVLTRHMLPLAGASTVSLVSVFDAAPIANGRPMILTDAGITTVCSYGRIAGLIRNAVEVAHRVMRIARPRVAVLSASEKHIQTLGSAQLGAAFAQREWPGAVVYGPLSLDLATDPAAVAVKGLPEGNNAREVAGQADILVCPNIESANVIYKMISALIKYGEASLANIIAGFPLPYVLLSRSDALETRLNSLALGAIYAQRCIAEHAVKTAATRPKAISSHRVLAINPGSTSTKIALYEADRCIQHIETVSPVPAMKSAEERRRQTAQLVENIQNVLEAQGWRRLDALAARGGFIPRPPQKLRGGVYRVAEVHGEEVAADEALVNAMLERPEKDHASNLGIPVAAALARILKIPAFVVDPVVVDEFTPEAEISGFEGVVRKSTSHALSVRAAMRRAAQALGRPAEQLHLVVAHLGGGITVAAVRQGRMIDNNISLLGGGPFTPQRAGQLPIGEVIELCYSGQYSRTELSERLSKEGGLQSYLADYRLEVIEQRIEAGDEKARLIVDALAYQIAKEIGAMHAAAGCFVDAIVLTGGMARSARMRGELRNRVGRLAPILVFEESLEMEALAGEVMRALNGEIQPMRFQAGEAR